MHEVLRGVSVSNGLDWSPDGSRAYFNDTATSRVSVFAYDPERGLHDRRTFAEIPREVGLPDGLTVDSQGGVWVALYGGGAVRRYSAAGVLEEVIEVPAAKVTACTFGGERLDELFITTSREGLAPGEDPLAGSLFRARVRRDGPAGARVRGVSLHRAPTGSVGRRPARVAATMGKPRWHREPLALRANAAGERAQTGRGAFSSRIPGTNRTRARNRLPLPAEPAALGRLFVLLLRRGRGERERRDLVRLDGLDLHPGGADGSGAGDERRGRRRRNLHRRG